MDKDNTVTGVAGRAGFSGHPAGVYIHVPFCRRRCLYCGFYSTVRLDLIDRFQKSCRREIRLAIDNKVRVDSIYFGGGTPSLLSAGQVGELIDDLSARIELASDAEISLEANAGTMDLHKLKQYREAGVNRLNMGVQSFDDDMLAFLGRLHTGRQALEAIAEAHRAGFDNLGIDLIYGAAGQTLKLWEKDLQTAADAGIDHISCYMLTIDENSKFAELERSGRTVLADEARLADLFRFTGDFWEKKGWLHYEVSNFARSKDFKSRHNWKYWTGAAYLGLGPSAHGFNGRDTRCWNHTSLSDYLSDLDKERLPRAGREILTRQQRLLEIVYLGLRTAAGLDLAGLRHDFPGTFAKICENLETIQSHGWGYRYGDCFMLSRQGMLRVDGICRFVVLSI